MKKLLTIFFLLCSLLTTAQRHNKPRTFNHTDKARTMPRGEHKNRDGEVYTIRQKDGMVTVWRQVKCFSGYRPQMVGKPMEHVQARGAAPDWITLALQNTD